LSIFFCRGAQEISCKKYEKSTRGVHFTILPASPYAAEFYEIWHTRSTHRHNHVCQIFSRSVQGLRSPDTPKIAISHWLAALPLQQCSTAVRHCDIHLKNLTHVSHLSKVIQGRRNRHITFHSNHGHTLTVSKKKGDFSRKSQISPAPCIFVAPMKRFPLNLGIGARGQKLQWWGYQAKKGFDDVVSYLDTIHIASHGKKCILLYVFE